MTQIPSLLGMLGIPPGVDPYDWLQYQAQVQNQQSRQQSRLDRNNDRLLWATMADAQGKQEFARQANESRYQDILELLGITRKNVLDDVRDFGSSLMDDVEQNRKRREGLSTSNMSRLGMLGSEDARRGAQINNDEATQREKSRAKDSLLSQRSAAEERLMNNIAGFMERKTDAYPNIGGMNMLMQGAGRAGIGGGFGGLGVTPSAGQPWSWQGPMGNWMQRQPRGTGYTGDPSVFLDGGIGMGGGGFGPRTRGVSNAMVPIPRPAAQPVPARTMLPGDQPMRGVAGDNGFYPAGADPTKSNPYSVMMGGTKPIGWGDVGTNFDVIRNWQQANRGPFVHGMPISTVPGFIGGGEGMDPQIVALLGQLSGGGRGGFGPRMRAPENVFNTPAGLSPAARRTLQGRVDLRDAFMQGAPGLFGPMQFARR